MMISKKRAVGASFVVGLMVGVSAFACATTAQARPRQHRAIQIQSPDAREGASMSDWEQGARAFRTTNLGDSQASLGSDVSSGGVSFGGSALVDNARSYIGTNPTSRNSLWCARFMNMMLEKSGHRGTGSDMARSFAQYGRRVSGPQVGAIAVMSRGRNGGHVGVVSGIDARGNPIIISGNHGRRVAESVYSRGRVYAYVMPE